MIVIAINSLKQKHIRKEKESEKSFEYTLKEKRHIDIY